MSRTAGARLRLDLLGDGDLCIEGPVAVLRALASWLPGCARPLQPGAPQKGALLQLLSSVPPRAPHPVPQAAPTLRLANAAAWPAPPDRWLLAGPSGAVGELDLARLRGRLHARAPAPELPGLAGIAAALLLARMGRALVHAGAVVAPDGRAWLLPGDSGAGKTSTVRTLAEAGWEWLADDHLVLREADGEAMVEGWPRGYDVDRRRGLAVDHWRRWRPRAPIAGTLLPVVRPDAPTRLTPATPAEALARLIRQSPWLLADPAAAPGLLALLRAIALCPAYHLELGEDTHDQPERLAAVLVALPGA